MSYQVTYTKRFEKSYKQLSSNEQKQIMKKLDQLVSNPTHPSLRTKRIKGTSDLFECSVNMSIRIIWYYEGEQMMILLDVGHHDILNKY